MTRTFTSTSAPTLTLALTLSLGWLAAHDAAAQGPPTPPAARVGDLGESCRSRADCAEGLKCVANVCRAELEGQPCGAAADCGAHLQCRANVCVAPPGALPPATAPPAATPLPGVAPAPGAVPPGEGVIPDYGGPPPPGVGVGGAAPAAGPTLLQLRPPRRKTFDGTRAFVGLTLAPGAVVPTPAATLLFGLRGGLLFGSTELALELAPASLVIFDESQYAFSVTMTIGGYPGLASHLYWPLRFGIGYAGGPDLPNSFVVRADLLGIAYGTPHLLFEVSLPSFRHVTEFDLHTFLLLINISASWVF